MIYYEVKSLSGEVVVSNIRLCEYYEQFKLHKSATLPEIQVKSAYRKFENTTIWIIVQDDSDLYRSNKLFNLAFQQIHQLSSLFLEYYIKKIKNHSHTLRSIQGKMVQKIDSLATKKDFRATSYAESKQKISTLIASDIDKTADIICHLKKRVEEIDVHIDGFDILYMNDQSDVIKKIKLKPVNIKKVMLNITSPFLADFESKGVDIVYLFSDEYASKNKILLDYHLFDLAYCNFIHNAIKYTFPNSQMLIDFVVIDESIEISITMISLRIDQDELSTIFEEGYSGKHSNNDAGDGIGMAVLKKALILTDIQISINPNYSASESWQDRQYIENKFILKRL